MISGVQILLRRVVACLINNEVKEIWKTKLKVLYMHLHEGTEENHKNEIHLVSILKQISTKHWLGRVGRSF
jgi:hypothetical protein